MNDTTMEQFLLENEEKTNSVMQRIFWFCTLAFPMFFIGKFLQIFPHILLLYILILYFELLNNLDFR